jgi:nicotinamidase-related amidase
MDAPSKSIGTLHQRQAPLNRILWLLFIAQNFFVTHAMALEIKPSAELPRKSALVVVDAQVGVLSSVWEPGRLVGNIEDLVRKARLSGAPVFWVQHSDNELKYGSDHWKLAPNLTALPSEALIQKNFNSAFANTTLDRSLRDLGVTRLVLAGAATNWCIRATAYSALDRGYELTVVSDGHSTEDLPLADGRSIPAQDIIAEFNKTMRWISVPDVGVGVKAAKDVEF